MYKRKKILAIIPARSGSKRLPGKNIKLLHKKPLIYYSITAAAQCPLINHTIVSTDSQRIANIARRYGANASCLRPRQLAGDSVSDHPVVKHALECAETNNHTTYDYIILLRPTSPLRTSTDITRAVQTAVREKLSLLRSVTEVSGVEHPYWMYRINGKTLQPFVRNVTLKNYYQSSKLPKHIVRLNGAVEVFSRSQVLHSTFLYDAKKIGYITMPPEKAVDIDTPIDFQLASLLMKHQ